MTDSQALLAEYVKNGSEPAFRELVGRYVGLVYCTALRLVGGDTHLAEDAAQIVFADLARTARTLSQDALLGGWLHRDACFVASKIMRGERRRQSRERQAAEMNALNNTPDGALAEIAPVLDEAINQLGEKDRAAILLRFFEQRDLSSVGQAMGITENAVQKRVTRALEKLHLLLKHRGVTLSAGTLATALASQAVAAPPAGLAVSISNAAALAATTVASTATATTIKAIAMTTIQKTLIAATFAALAGAGFYEAQQAWRLRDQAQALQQQQAVLTEQLERASSENKSLSSQLVQAGHSPSVSSERLRELLRLRGEVGVFRRQQHELEQTLAAAQSKGPQNAAHPSVAPPQPSAPVPFQVQLVADEPGQDTEPMTNSASGANGDTVHVNKTPLLDYTAIRSANVTKNAASGAPEINVELSDEGKELFAAVTKENLNKRLAIVMNGQLYGAPVIRSEITDGKTQITGNFTEEEARQIAAKINEAIRYQ